MRHHPPTRRLSPLHAVLLAVLAVGLMLSPIAPARAGGVTTIALWDFENATIADMDTLVRVDYLTRILPEMLLSHLSGVKGLKLVERVQLRRVLEEQKLGSSELADEDAKLRLGRILGAQRMVFGQFMVLAGTLRIDARVVDVATSEILVAEAAMGMEEQANQLAEQLAATIAERLAGQPLPAGSGGGSAADSAVWATYDEGIKLMDQGRFDAAIGHFQALLEQHPDFKPAEKQITLAVEQLSRQ